MSRKMMVFMRGCAVAGVLALCSAAALRADSVVFSSSIDLTGTTSYGGGSDPLVGTNIQIREVSGPDGVKHAVHLIGGLGTGQLNFETGDFIKMLGSDLVFGSTGPDDFIQIYGTVPDAGVFGPPTPLLLSGTVLGAIVDPQLGTIKLGLELNAGFDQENPQLMDYFGLPENSRFFFTTLTVTGALNVQSDGSFDGRTISTTVTNTLIPEPSSITLGLTSLFLLVWLGRTARKRATSGR